MPKLMPPKIVKSHLKGKVVMQREGRRAENENVFVELDL